MLNGAAINAEPVNGLGPEPDYCSFAVGFGVVNGMAVNHGVPIVE
jgi:hypothetical protein